MDQLPRELFQEILFVYAHLATKNHVLSTRLVCRDFNAVLRPLACRTLSLDASRLSNYGRPFKPNPEALQTIGHRCKALQIDMMVLRDEEEMYMAFVLGKNDPNVWSVFQGLRLRYCFGTSTFTESDFFTAVSLLLFFCRDVTRTCIHLPKRLDGRNSDAATRVLANIFKALATRPDDDDYAPLTTLVVEHVADQTLCSLWTNPTDVNNMKTILLSLQTLALSLVRQSNQDFPPTMYALSLWNMVYRAARLQSLCIANDVNQFQNQSDNHFYNNFCLDPRDPSYASDTIMTDLDMDPALWLQGGLPGPLLDVAPPPLKYLALKHLSVTPDELIRIVTTFGPSIEELCLDNVLLMTRRSQLDDSTLDQQLWVGLPNQKPGRRQWMAMMLRSLMPNLRSCRCTQLGYILFAEGEYARFVKAENPDAKQFEQLDEIDPAGLNRSVAERFVNVVMGIRQPPLPSGEPVVYYPQDSEHDELSLNLSEKKTRLDNSEHDYYLRKLAAVDRLPDYQHSIDGLFPNCTDRSLKEVQQILDCLRGSWHVNRETEEAA